MCNEIMKKEVQEAIAAGERALQSLYAAEEKLKSAGNWGVFDMLGGGFFSSYIKHSKIKEAEILLKQAKSRTAGFSKRAKRRRRHAALTGGGRNFLLCVFLTVLWRIIWCRIKFQMPEKR